MSDIQETEERARRAITELRSRVGQGLDVGKVGKAIGRKRFTIALWLAGHSSPRGKVLARLEGWLRRAPGGER